MIRAWEWLLRCALHVNYSLVCRSFRLRRSSYWPCRGPRRWFRVYVSSGKDKLFNESFAFSLCLYLITYDPNF